MSPRAYQMGRRQEQVDEIRRRVLDAARALLRESGSYTSFTVDAVARRADVARATVYYQFGSKTRLLEAVCDDIAEAGAMSGLAGALTQPDLEGALAEFIAVFGRFWAADRQVMRRLRALAALDPDVETVIAARDARRLQAVTALLGRFDGARGSVETNARVLYTLTSFETYDTLAGLDGDVAGAAPLVRALAVAALGLAASGAGELSAEGRAGRAPLRPCPARRPGWRLWSCESHRPLPPTFPAERAPKRAKPSREAHRPREMSGAVHDQLSGGAPGGAGGAHGGGTAGTSWTAPPPASPRPPDSPRAARISPVRYARCAGNVSSWLRRRIAAETAGS